MGDPHLTAALREAWAQFGMECVLDSLAESLPHKNEGYINRLRLDLIRTKVRYMNRYANDQEEKTEDDDPDIGYAGHGLPKGLMDHLMSMEEESEDGDEPLLEESRTEAGDPEEGGETVDG